MTEETDLPVVSDDTWLNDMAYRLLGSECVRDLLDCDASQVGNRARTIEMRTRRRYALLDETAFCDLYRPGLDWLDVVELADNLGVRLRGSFLGDVRDLLGFGLITGQWVLPDLPDARTVSMSVARVREGILKNPRVARAGDVQAMARTCGLSTSRLMGIVVHSPLVRYELSLTPAGFRLID